MPETGGGEDFGHSGGLGQDAAIHDRLAVGTVETSINIDGCEIGRAAKQFTARNVAMKGRGALRR